MTTKLKRRDIVTHSLLTNCTPRRVTNVFKSCGGRWWVETEGSGWPWPLEYCELVDLTKNHRQRVVLHNQARKTTRKLKSSTKSKALVQRWDENQAKLRKAFEPIDISASMVGSCFLTLSDSTGVSFQQAAGGGLAVPRAEPACSVKKPTVTLSVALQVVRRQLAYPLPDMELLTAAATLADFARTSLGFAKTEYRA